MSIMTLFSIVNESMLLILTVEIKVSFSVMKGFAWCRRREKAKVAHGDREEKQVHHGLGSRIRG